MTQNGCHLQILFAVGTGKTEDAKFIASCQMNSSMHTNIFILKERIFYKFSFHV